MDSASDFESEGCGFDPHPRCFGTASSAKRNNWDESSYILLRGTIYIPHGSSVGRAGDCNSESAVIPRPVVRFRPVRFFAPSLLYNHHQCG